MNTRPPYPINHVYVSFQVNIFHKSILLIVQYKYLKSCSEDFSSKIQQKSDSPHDIMHYFIYYSKQMASSFPPGRNLPCGNDLYHSCTSFGGASWRGQPLNIFTWFIGSGGFLSVSLSLSLFFSISRSRFHSPSPSLSPHGQLTKRNALTEIVSQHLSDTTATHVRKHLYRHHRNTPQR